MDKGKADKATWDSIAHRIFLDICVEEVRANNRLTQCLNNVGYANLISKFNECTHRNYERKQFKNRWETLKQDYSTWKSLNQHASSLGRDPIMGTIDASNEWWEAEIKKCPEAAKFRIAPLDNEDKMRIIFDTHSVTNEHARVLAPIAHVGTFHAGEEEEDAGSGCEGLGYDDGTPVHGKVRKKRSTGYSPNPTSPKRRTEKESNSRLDRILDLVEKKSQNSVTSTSQMSVDPVRQEIREMLDMVVQDGAEEGSDEHFYVTQLLMKKECRDVFITLKTPHGRLAWLKRIWEEKKKR